MRLACFFGFHDYEAIGHKTIDYFETDESKRPYATNDIFLLQCKHCNNLKEKKLQNSYNYQKSTSSEDEILNG